jgi:hypothetical protein
MPGAPVTGGPPALQARPIQIKNQPIRTPLDYEVVFLVPLTRYVEDANPTKPIASRAP